MLLALTMENSYGLVSDSLDGLVYLPLSSVFARINIIDGMFLITSFWILPMTRFSVRSCGTHTGVQKYNELK